MNKKAQKMITEVEVQDAIQRFIARGGLIKHLPEEIIVPNTMVGHHWGMYEQVSSTSLIVENEAKA